MNKMNFSSCFQANAIVERIGYPAYILNETILANMYDHVRKVFNF